MPSTQPEQTAPRVVLNASSAAQTEAVEPMVSFLASKSSSRDGIACTNMHAAKMETSTQVTDVQTNGSLHFLGMTSIIYQKLCKHWRYQDRHWFSCGFCLQYMGPRLFRGSDDLNVNLQNVKSKIQKCFWFPPFPSFLLQALYPKRTCTSFIISITRKFVYQWFYRPNSMLSTVQLWRPRSRIENSSWHGCLNNNEKEAKTYIKVLYNSLYHDYGLLRFRF